MLLIDIPRIPPEGLDVDQALDSLSLHLEGETEFRLGGARLVAKIDLVDGTTVHVRGRLSGSVSTDCGRCLEAYDLPVGQELDLFFLPRAQSRPRLTGCAVLSHCGSRRTAAFMKRGSFSASWTASST